MARVTTVGAAQLGPIARSESRSQVVKRLIDHLHQARARGCDLVVFPELCLTTFFPRWFMEDQAEIDSFFDDPTRRRSSTSRATASPSTTA